MAEEAKQPSTEPYEAVCVHRGVVFLRAFITQEEQLKLYECVSTTYSQLGPMQHHGSIATIMKKSVHRGSYLLFFENSAHLIPEMFADISQRAMAAAHRVSDVIPSEYDPSRMNCKLYPVGSGLKPHMDNHEGWVVLFSLGCDCKFYLQIEDQNEQVICMKSGDMLIFNGNNASQVTHGVEEIVSDTSPSFLPSELRKSRIGLQLRNELTTS